MESEVLDEKQRWSILSKLTLDDSFNGFIDTKHWYEHEKVRVEVKEHHSDGYEADTEENSHNPTKWMTMFSFKYSDAIYD